MLEKLHRRAKHLGTSLPFVRNLVLRAKYREEIRLIHGVYGCPSDHRSILHFSANKSATQYVKRILRDCAKENGMIHVDLGGYAFHSTFPYLDQLTHEQLEDYQHVFRPSGYVYSPFGGMIDGIRGLEHYRVLVVLRDPRDVLTSEFFSIRHSHRTPPVASDKHAQFSALRNRARALTIDEYVLSESPRVRATYQRYIDRLLEPGHDVGVLKYEDMIADFPKWLGQLERFCELSISPQLRGRLTSSARQAAARKERIASHARQLLPGDHRRKLHGATIGELNRRFAEILDRLEYDPS